MWIPFILFWALPLWTPREVGIWLGFFSVALATIFAVALYHLHYYLLGCHAGVGDDERASWDMKGILPQALLFAMFSQLWLEPYGLRWYLSSERAYVASIAVVLLIVFIERLVRTNAPELCRTRTRALLIELRSYSSTRLLGCILITICALGVWQLLSLSPLEEIFSSPVMVLLVLTDLLREEVFWQDLSVSVLEIIGALLVAAGCTVICYRVLPSRRIVKGWGLLLFARWELVVFVLSVAVVSWSGEVNYWRRILSIGLVVTYPMLETLWEVKEQPVSVRLMLAIDSALPYAVVLMLFSEALASTGGLGFSIVLSHTRKDTLAEGIAMAVVILILLATLSRGLHWTVRQLQK
jgi:ABC-type nitrate/sulfonate/bicarbonate transport system permease component